MPKFDKPEDITRLVLEKNTPETWYSQRGGKNNRIEVQLALKGSFPENLLNEIRNSDMVPVTWSVLLKDGSEIKGEERKKYVTFSVSGNCTVEEPNLKMSLTSRMAVFYFRYRKISKKSGGPLRIKFSIGNEFDITSQHTQVLTKKNQKRKSPPKENEDCNASVSSSKNMKMDPFSIFQIGTQLSSDKTLNAGNRNPNSDSNNSGLREELLREMHSLMHSLMAQMREEFLAEIYALKAEQKVTQQVFMKAQFPSSFSPTMHGLKKSLSFENSSMPDFQLDGLGYFEPKEENDSLKHEVEW